jgi:predicted TIM-barrel fold metal-dependent hydrolase
MDVRILAFALAAAAAFVGTQGLAQDSPPIKFVDVHMHVMTENITPDEEVALMKKVGVSRAVFMDNDPEKLAALAKKYPEFVIPSISITRPTPNGLGLNENTGPEIEKLYKEHKICAIGEVGGGNLSADSAGRAPIRGILAAAQNTGAPIIFHIDLAKPETVAAVESVLTAYPKMKFVLAHLGWTAGPDLIGRLLDAHSNLYTDVSIRLDAPGSLAWRNRGLDLSVLQADETFPPAWRAVIDRHPDRFLFATDINSFGPRYTIAADLMATARKALASLPRTTQELIAHGNVERLLGSCAN